MRAALINLFALQSLTRRGGVPKIEELDAIDQLRNRLPTPIVSTFDQRTASGRTTVAVVRHGLCGACHAPIRRETFADLLSPHVLAICDNCGCFLYLAHEDIPGSSRPEAAKGGRA